MTTNNSSQVETWWPAISNEDKLHLIQLEHEGYRVLSMGLFEAIGKVGGQTCTLDILGPGIYSLFPREWDWIREQGGRPRRTL